jgi:exonuclease SbcD
MVPRVVEIVRVPRRGAAPLAEVLAELARLPLLVPGDPARPYLEVVVALERPEPKLRAAVEAALDGKRPRLIRLGVEATGDGGALGDRVVQQRLAELDPRDVFVRLWGRDHAEPPSEAVLAGFDRLRAEIEGDREDVAS